MFAVDDDIEASAKHEALDVLSGDRRSRAFEAWLRLGAACRKRGTGGLVSRALVSKILHAWKPAERERTLTDLVEARGGREHGLLVIEGDGWRFHAWAEWQPDEEEAAEERGHLSKKTLRQRRWRHRKRLGVDADVDGQASTVDAAETPTSASTETPTKRLPVVPRATRSAGARAHDPVPSPPVHPSDADEHITPFAENLERLWRAWAKSYSAARGQIAGRTHGAAMQDVCRVLSEHAEATGEDFENVLDEVLARYWTDPWPRQHANRANFANLQAQLVTLLGATPTGDPPDYDPAKHGEPKDPANFPAWNRHLDRIGGLG